MIMAEANPEAQGAAETLEAGEFASLLEKNFKPKSDRQKEAIEDGVKTLAAQALSDTALVSDDAVKSIEAIIAEIDRKLTEQVNLILHHEDFQQLEGAWRGLHHLVNNTETDETLKIRVMNISKKDLARPSRSSRAPPGTRARCSRRSTKRSTASPGGEPYGCLVGDYHFDHTRRMSRSSAAWPRSPRRRTRRSSPGSDPKVMNMDSWQELSNPRDLTKIFQSPEYARGVRCAKARTRSTSGSRCPVPQPDPLRREDQPGR
jgi:type VI secretion system protein ImpC